MPKSEQKRPRQAPSWRRAELRPAIPVHARLSGLCVAVGAGAGRAGRGQARLQRQQQWRDRLSVRDVAKRMNCCVNTAARALRELVETGFIEPRTRGAFHIKFRRAAEWRLNDRRCDATGKEQSQAFMRWAPSTPPEEAKEREPRKVAKPPPPWRVQNMSRAKWYRHGKPASPGTG